MTTNSTVGREHAPNVSRLIAAEVRAEMGRQGVSKHQLATRLGVSDVWIGRRLKVDSTVQITLEEVEQMAEALGVSSQRLLAAWLPRLDSNQQPSGYASVLVAEAA
jgi:transcriptional regulator with XRE-family HTH domain